MPRGLPPRFSTSTIPAHTHPRNDRSTIMAPRTQPKDHQKSAAQILDEQGPFDWTVGDKTHTLPPVSGIPGGGRLILRSVKGEITEAEIVEVLFDKLEDVPGLTEALDACTIGELSNLLDNWLRVVDAGE